MHIVLHTQYFPPEVGAPQTRLYELAVGLVKRGVRVTILTAMPSYPVGRIFNGFGRLFQNDNLDGMQVIRTAIYPTQSAQMLPRLLSYFSFLISSCLVGFRKINTADYVLTESPPLFLGLAGLLLSLRAKSRWIFNISDLWPESVVELGLLKRNSIGYKLASSLEKSLYKRAWIVTCQSQTTLEYIVDRFPNVRVYHLPNGVDTKLFQPSNDPPLSKKFMVVYAGLHGLAQGLDQIIWAAQKIPPTAGINFTFVGDGPEKRKLINLASELNLGNFQFLESVPKNKVPELLQGADVILVPLKTQLTGAVPSKLYEAMSMEKPLILIAGSEAAQIVEKANCGIVVSPGDIDGLANALNYLSAHPEERMQMGLRGREAAVQSHDRAYIVEEFAQLLVNG